MRKETAKLIAGVVVAVLVIAAFGLALKYYEKSGQKKGDNSRTQYSMYIDIVIDEVEYETNHYIESYLLFGTDESGTSADSPEGYHGGVADFLLLAILDKTTDKYALVEIDRNTMFEVRMIGPNGEDDMSFFQQISLANWYGMNPAQSAENMVNAVSELFGGLPIDGYFSIGINDVYKLNDAVGGVTITVPDDALLKADPAFTKGAKIKLSDKQAELFVRSRMSYGEGTNEERMARQRVFLNALLGQLKEKSKKNPDIAEDIYNVLIDTAVTDMNAKSISRITNHMLKGEKIEGSDETGIISIDGEHKMGRQPGDKQDYQEFYYDTESIVEILEKAIGLKPLES